jgi:hypothetical protein
MDTRVKLVTVRVAAPPISPFDALMYARPAPTPVASPAATVATFEFDDVHVTDFVRSWWVPSL